MKKHYLFGAMALGLILGGCSSDDLLVPEDQGPMEIDQTFYVRMTIKGDNSQSRAADETGGSPVAGTDFEDGTEDESGINNVYFVFYDAAGNVVGDIVPVDIENWTTGSSIVDQTVEKYYTSVVPVKVNKGELKPSQVICYVNPISPTTLNQPLGVIQTVSRTSTYGTVGSTRYFAMSNSVYYPFDGQTNKPSETAEPHIAVSIPATALYTSEAAAKDAIGSENTVNIYVERYATKLSFTAVDPTNYTTATRVYNGEFNAEGNPLFETKKVTLNFIPLYWAVNAESNSTYVIKSYKQESETGEILAHNYNYGTLNAFINPKDYNDANQTWIYPALGAENAAESALTSGGWVWNNAAYHRSYWGMSPAYFTEEYPEVSSDLKDLTVNQKYISFNELATPNNGIGFAAKNTTAQYFRETTVGSKALNSANPNAAVASVIYVGKYTLTLGDTELPDGTSFYTYLAGPVPYDNIKEDRPYIYFDNQSGSNKSAVRGGESMLYRFFAQTTILYRASTPEEIEAGEGIYTRLTVADDADLNMLTDALEVSEISDDVRTAYDGDENTKLKLQHNSRSLQFKGVEEAEGIYVVTAGGYMKIVDEVNDPTTEVTLAQANVTLMGQVGFSYYYTSGHAYFSIPVKHYGWYRDANAQKDNDEIDWNTVRVGDFGMVRNHSYKMNVSEIKGLASGIGDDDTPIVPPTTPEDYYVAYAVHILRWAVVPQQDVKL